MTEQSYGVVPFFKDEETGNLEVFLIHQYGSAGDTLWTFPKGRQEVWESPKETALRELKEETGMEAIRLDKSKTYSVSYSFSIGGKKIDKTATYFVGYTESKDFKIQEKEVKEAGWFSLESARERLTFPDYKTLLDEVVADLDNVT